MTEPLWIVRCGVVGYEAAREAQRRIADARQASEIPDVLLLLEHDPVYTRGRRSQPAELPMGEDWYRMQGIEVCNTDRGGLVTYHGPGQLVGYPIVDLNRYGGDVHEYVRRMERVMIGALADLEVEAGLNEGLTGVWASERKIGSIGVHVSRGVTTHGFAVNVCNDLQPFSWIVPCGIEDCRVTSVSRERGRETAVDELANAVITRFAEIYERAPDPVEAADLAERIPGCEALAGREQSGALR